MSADSEVVLTWFGLYRRSPKLQHFVLVPPDVLSHPAGPCTSEDVLANSNQNFARNIMNAQVDAFFESGV